MHNGVGILSCWAVVSDFGLFRFALWYVSANSISSRDIKRSATALYRHRRGRQSRQTGFRIQPVAQFPPSLPAKNHRIQSSFVDPHSGRHQAYLESLEIILDSIRFQGAGQDKLYSEVYGLRGQVIIQRHCRYFAVIISRSEEKTNPQPNCRQASLIQGIVLNIDSSRQSSKKRHDRQTL